MKLNSLENPDIFAIYSMQESKVSSRKLSEVSLSNKFSISGSGRLDNQVNVYNRSDHQNILSKDDQIHLNFESDIEKIIAGCFQEVLDQSITVKSRDDNFFLLGGHSLLVSRCVTLLRVHFPFLGLNPSTVPEWGWMTRYRSRH